MYPLTTSFEIKSEQSLITDLEIYVARCIEIMLETENDIAVQSGHKRSKSATVGSHTEKRRVVEHRSSKIKENVQDKIKQN